MFPGQVEWVSTRPQTFAEKILYRCDPEAWREQFLKKIETTPCDAAFFIGWNKDFRSLKPNPNFTLYLIDDLHILPGDSQAFGRVFLSDPGYENELRAIVKPEQYGGVLPFAHHPALHHPMPFSGTKKDLCFIGNRDAKRDPYLERLFADGFRPRIVGNYFGKTPLFWQYPLAFWPAVSNDRMGGIYARHKVSLNVHARVVREGTNMRTFECAGYGIPQLVEYRSGIENYFEPEKEILFFRNEDEMVAQLRMLLNNSAGAQAMADAAHRRSLAHHTYKHRIARCALGHLLPGNTLLLS